MSAIISPLVPLTLPQQTGTTQRNPPFPTPVHWMEPAGALFRALCHCNWYAFRDLQIPRYRHQVVKYLCLIFGLGLPGLDYNTVTNECEYICKVNNVLCNICDKFLSSLILMFNLIFLLFILNNFCFFWLIYSVYYVTSFDIWFCECHPVLALWYTCTCTHIMPSTCKGK